MMGGKVQLIVRVSCYSYTAHVDTAEFDSNTFVLTRLDWKMPYSVLYYAGDDDITEAVLGYDWQDSIEDEYDERQRVAAAFRKVHRLERLIGRSDAYVVPLVFCERSKINVHPEDYFKPNTCLVIAEDTYIPWNLSYIDSNGKLSEVDIVNIPHLSDAVRQLQLPFRRSIRLSGSELDPLRKLISDYQQQLIPVKQCADWAIKYTTTIYPYVKMKEQQFLDLRESIEKCLLCASLITGNLETGVLRETAVYFAAQFKRYLLKWSGVTEEESFTFKYWQSLEDIALISLIVAVKLTHDGYAVPNDIWLEYGKNLTIDVLNNIERKCLIDLDFNVNVDEAEYQAILKELLADNVSVNQAVPDEKVTKNPATLFYDCSLDPVERGNSLLNVMQLKP